MGALLWIVLFGGVIAAPPPALATQQILQLKAGWNLITFAVQPASPTVATVLAPLVTSGKFQALWAFDAGSGTWNGYVPPSPTLPSGVSTITSVETGRGYWLRVTSQTSLAVDGAATPPVSPSALVPGWQLLGFPLDTAKSYDRVFAGSPIREIWTFDAAAGQFRGVVLPQGVGGAATKEDFTNIDPGKGYWVLINQPFDIAPVLGTALPPDTDVSPLLSDEGPNAPRQSWIPFTPGDVDVGDDDFFYDRPGTQREMTFADGGEVQSLSISNVAGVGVLSWSAAIDDPSAYAWLKFRQVDPVTHETLLSNGLSGTVATDTASIDLVADRTGLTPGDYIATVTVQSNGRATDEPTRTLKAYMHVADIVGDYEIRTKIDTINGQPADTASPKIFLSIYRDVDGLKAIIDKSRTLLFPVNAHLAGAVYQTGTNRFSLSGSFELPVGDPSNPYQVALRRDVTLLGDRSAHGDAGLGPLDVKGDYRETIRNVLGAPIYVAGTFAGRRTGSVPTTLDVGDGGNEQSGNIPDPGSIEKILNVAKRVLITGLSITVRLTHPRPEDLVLTLIGPDGETVVLRDQSPINLGTITFPDTATPKGDLTVFNGKLSSGNWTLRVEDVTVEESGSFFGASLKIQGTAVFSLSGTIVGVGPGATVLLTGCGLVREVQPVGGTYRFDNLIDCAYSVTVQAPGFQRTTTLVDVSGGDRTQNLVPTAAPPDVSLEVALPRSPNGCTECYAFSALLTGVGAGTLLPAEQLRYAHDSATFDIDRPPLNPTTTPGLEDSNAFLDAFACLTRSNAVGGNSRIDGPAPADPQLCPTADLQTRYLSVALGYQMLGGRSVAPGSTIAIGANPAMEGP